MKDLTGQRFGRLVALEPTGKRSRQLVVWRCRCDCGNVCEVASSSLVKGNTRSCGCLQRDARSRDITGERFGRLVVVAPTEKRCRGAVVWRCRCDCGNEVEVHTGVLRSGQVRSCGCLRRESSAKDLAGQRFGRLTAIRPLGRRNRYVLWECKCDCGNTCEATTNLLTSGRTRSCGCLAGKAKRDRGTGAGRDLAGQRFGRLVAKRPAGRRNGYVLWVCECDCGNTARVAANQLVSGKTRSCGCMRSKDRMSDLAGQRFGSLIACEPTGKRENGSVVWRCLCDCGRACEMSAFRLKRLKHPSCGQHEPSAGHNRTC